MDKELHDLGDALEQAIARDLAARTTSGKAEALASRRHLRRVVGVAATAGAVGLLGVGVAAAVVALDEDEVEAGLPGGSVIFIATDPTCTAAVEPDVFDYVLTPFVYRRYLDYGVFDALRQMKRLIAQEVARKDLAENIKLGPGGIREIEFIVQAFQIVRGGRRPELRSRSLL